MAARWWRRGGRRLLRRKWNGRGGGGEEEIDNEGRETTTSAALAAVRAANRRGLPLGFRPPAAATQVLMEPFPRPPSLPPSEPLEIGFLDTGSAEA
ncbi:hypothetical protein Drorol1_Dr00025017 [Drosera rotundifolia]